MSPTMLKFSNFVHQITLFLTFVCQWSLVLLAFMLMIDVFGRFFNKPIQGITLLSVFVIMTVFYLGLSKTEENDEHIRIEVLTDMFPFKTQKMLSLFNCILQILIYAIVIYALWKNLIFSYTTKEAIVGNVSYLIWPVKVIMLIGLIFYWLQILVNLLKNISTKEEIQKQNVDICNQID